ncbi:transmembrane protein 9B-like [Dendronephthya gigantea]|uniref:transmembrane protein 9B-like n=1 Tax=Dendronephthya gigantea TaxID=151771 RepID=UPI0010694CAE|nr:transmembrane protein 9B-like [Dendronephthya gigantea]
MFLSCVIFLSILTVAEAQYNDVRCKCVCPKDVLEHNIVVKFVVVENCTCKNLINLKDSSCLRCKCEYEARNTMLIKVVVIFIVLVLVILIVYMIGLYIFSLWKPQDPNLSIQSDPLQESLIKTSRLTRLDSKVSQWKDSVENQRRNVYNNHSILS